MFTHKTCLSKGLSLYRQMHWRLRWQRPYVWGPLMTKFLRVVMYLVAQLCPTLCNPMDCSPPGSSVHRLSKKKILEWVAIPFSRGSSWLRDRTWVSCIAGRFLTKSWHSQTKRLLRILVYLTACQILAIKVETKLSKPRKNIWEEQVEHLHFKDTRRKMQVPP